MGNKSEGIERYGVRIEAFTALSAAVALLVVACSSEPPVGDRDMITADPVMVDSTTVSVSITALALTSEKGEDTKELYAVALYTDGSPDRDAKTECEEREGLVLDCGAFTMVASPVYRNITIENPVSLSGSGIVLYPNRPPNGYLMVHVFVIESDRGAARIVKLIGGLAEKVASDEIGVLTGSSLGAMTAAANVIVESVKDFFVKDDALLEHTHSGFDYNTYGTDGSSVFVSRNGKVCMELNVVATNPAVEPTVSSGATTTAHADSCDPEPPNTPQTPQRTGTVPACTRGATRDSAGV